MASIQVVVVVSAFETCFVCLFSECLSVNRHMGSMSKSPNSAEFPECCAE